MFDAGMIRILLTALAYGAFGSLAAVGVRLFNRHRPGPRLDQSAAVGFLVGAAFGASVGIFQSWT